MALRIDKRLGTFARTMRNEPTEPEKRLWRHLSNNQLGGHKFRRQTVIGRYVCDFACSQNGLVIEVDGDTHVPEVDDERDAELAGLGYHVIRFSNGDVMQNMEGVLTRILAIANTLPERRYNDAPAPTPPLEGRG